MASVPVHAFHDEIASSLTAGAAEMLDDARGGGPEFREMNRALMLADRAAREWAASAIASERPGAPNHLEQLGQLGKPEDAHHVLDPAARLEQTAATSTGQCDVALPVQDLAAAVQELDTESIIVEQANAAMADLVPLAGWHNQLGPRFE